MKQDSDSQPFDRESSFYPSILTNFCFLYSFDLVDFTRQYLVLLGSSFYNLTMESYFKKDFPEFLTRTSQFLELLDDLEIVLKTNEHFMLGPWLEASKALGTTDEEKTLLEYNARVQVSISTTFLREPFSYNI